MATRDALDCSGCNLPHAAGFRRTREAMERFEETVRTYWSQEHLPARTETVTWRVYLVRPSKWFYHHSLLVQSAESGYSFTIELVVDVESRSVVPTSRLFDPSDYPQLDYTRLGEVTTSAKALFGKALKCLERFGDYYYYTHNCQDYCKVCYLCNVNPISHACSAECASFHFRLGAWTTDPG